MRELAPIENLLLDLVADGYQKKCLEENLRIKALPHANRKALVCFVQSFLGEETASIVFKHYHISDEGTEDTGPAVSQVAYLNAMEKLRNSDRPKYWYHFGWSPDALRTEQRLLEKEIRDYKKLLSDREEFLEDVKYVWEFLLIFRERE